MANLFKIIIYLLRFFILIYLNKKISYKNLVKIGNNIRIIVEPGATLSFGENAMLKDDTIIYVKKGASLIIGDNVNTGHHSEISVGRMVRIGNDVIMGAYSYITDSNHVYDRTDTPFRLQGMSLGEVTIGSNIWIGRGAMILKGAVIGDNSVIGAGSVVTGKFDKNVVIGGIPAKTIKHLGEINDIQ